METRGNIPSVKPAELFKSYYVVWKLKSTKGQYSCGSRFKSYYVVWKPEQYIETSKRKFCLNRTM